ncbi:MAG: hypothetical protein EXR59_01955 [Dehalococcoidia bacterium]|nr:hypothetical protein [Dehalococcoidia bacterium]
MNASSGQNLQDTDTGPSRIELGEYFLNRLRNMISARNQIHGQTKVEPWKVKALDRAIYSTILDCEVQDVKEEAKLILKGKSS